MNISDYFDALIILSSSEPGQDSDTVRNKHYRAFAASMPVIILQITDKYQKSISLKSVPLQNVDVVTISCNIYDQDVCSFRRLLYTRGIKRPLVWISELLDYKPLIEGLPGGFRICDISDYSGSEGDRTGINATMVELLSSSDLIVGPAGIDIFLAGNGVRIPCHVLIDPDSTVAVDPSHESLAAAIIRVYTQSIARKENLRVAVLYNSSATHVGTVRDHLESFRRYSANLITYIPATTDYWSHTGSDNAGRPDFSVYDVVIVHYSVRVSILNHLDSGIADSLENYYGLKVLFLQDEYEGTEVARCWIERLQFDIVYTCVPSRDLDYIFPAYRFPGAEFRQTLTGYVPEDTGFEQFIRPLEQRKLLIVYRGRKLPPIYGMLGYEKYRIGEEMKRIAGLRNLVVDIEVDETSRIYGDPWYEFLGSARATLGTETGSNVFDFDGALQHQIDQLQSVLPDITFDEIYEKVLAVHEARVHINQVSPKFFEAICLRTALVLFEGAYSGMLHPDVHYIPLKKDFSNIDEVLGKLADDAFLLKITSQAYKDLVASGRYSYRTFMENIDADIHGRVLHTCQHKLLTGPLLVVESTGKLREVLPALPVGITSGTHPMGRPLFTVELLELIPEAHARLVEQISRSILAPPPPTLIFRLVRRIWRLLPVAAKGFLMQAVHNLQRQLEKL